MRTSALALIVAAVALGGCATHSSHTGEDESPAAAAPSKLKPEAEEVPAQVRAIEPHIDRESVILAEEADIWVSKNYEYDVSLSGQWFATDTDASSRKFVQTGSGKRLWSSRPKDLDNSDGVEMIAQGNAVAFVRNLKVSCDRRLRVRIAGFGTEPFIKIRAKGHVSHVLIDRESKRHDVTRANAVVIDNERLQYVGHQSDLEPAAASTRR